MIQQRLLDKKYPITSRAMTKIKSFAIFVASFIALIWILDSPHVTYLKLSFGFNLTDIKDAKVQPRRDGGNVFFIETLKPVNAVADLKPRQACAIESAGGMNFNFFLDVVELIFVLLKLAPTPNSKFSCCSPTTFSKSAKLQEPLRMQF